MRVGPHGSGEKPTIAKELNCKRGEGAKPHLFHFILRDEQPVLGRLALRQVPLCSAASPGLCPGRGAGAGLAAEGSKGGSRGRGGGALPALSLPPARFPAPGQQGMGRAGEGPGIPLGTVPLPRRAARVAETAPCGVIPAFSHQKEEKKKGGRKKNKRKKGSECL